MADRTCEVRINALVPPTATASAELHTIMCLWGHDGGDVADVVDLLTSQGLKDPTISAIH